MILSYSIDPVLRLVTVRPDHLPSIEEFQELVDQLLRDALFQPGFAVLVDRRGLAVEPDATFVRGALELMTKHQLRGIRWATLTSHEATYGMGRMAESFAEQRGVMYRVFTEEVGAMNWLLDYTADPRGEE